VPAHPAIEPEWADLLTPADRRGLTPLFWSHVRPYGEVNLDMDARLNLAAAIVPGPGAHWTTSRCLLDSGFPSLWWRT
jgi:hypothetical protein